MRPRFSLLLRRVRRGGRSGGFRRVRDKRRAVRDRRRRSRAEHGLEVYGAWVWDRPELGWPSESSELRAFHRAQTKTRTNGIAAYHGRVEVDEGGRTAPKIPPPMPKETRPSTGPRIPRTDMARLGPHVDRLLRDMDELGLRLEARVLRACALFPREGRGYLARCLSLSDRTFYRLRRRGLHHLEVVMSYEPMR